MTTYGHAARPAPISQLIAAKPTPPVTLIYGRQRAQIARLLLNLVRAMRNTYVPELTLGELGDILFLGAHLFIGDVQNSPLTASTLAR